MNKFKFNYKYYFKINKFNYYLFLEMLLATKIKKLNKLESEIDNSIFSLIENRINITKKSKDLLETILNDQFNELVKFYFLIF